MIRIFIADDHPILRAGLKTLLSECEDMTVSGEASSGEEALRLVRSGEHDIVLLDITLPDMNGVDALKLIKRHRPGMAVLILSMHPEEQYAVNLLRAGASGYVPKEAAPEQLVSAIRTVMNGRRYVSAALAEVLARDLSDPEQQPSHSSLSEREFQIFCKLAAGMSVSQIAGSLNLSVKTISTYRARILEKMAMRNNADLISYAIKNRLVQ
jgi:two-component system, NarL family, invasion response regulator UvrY